LTPAQVAQRTPVRIRGAVTYVASLPSLLFVQDATGGICRVRLCASRRSTAALQRMGTIVEVEGVVTSPGRLSACNRRQG
jgi:hypothetical protein